MIDHLPVYRLPDGRIVQAGRIKEVRAGIVVSTAPISKDASKANGFPLKRITPDDLRGYVIDAGTIVAAGLVLVVSGERVETVTADTFEGTPVAPAPKPAPEQPS